MVFMDGGGYANPKGGFRVPVVFDNLIHRKAMPVTLAAFVSPGTVPPTASGAKDRSNRSFEYDSPGDRYASFLVEEFLPVALKGLNVSKGPAKRAVCGISSGGICAFINGLPSFGRASDDELARNSCNSQQVAPTSPLMSQCIELISRYFSKSL